MTNPFESSISESSSDGEKNTLNSFAANLVRSAEYTGLQSPVNGLVQFADHDGSKILPHLQFIDAPVKADAYSSDWVAQQVGGGVATVAQFAALTYFVHNPNAAEAGLVSGSKLGTSMAIGAGYAGVLTPVDPKGDFWKEKAENALTGAATFGAMEGMGTAFGALKNVDVPVLSTVMKHEAPASIAAGLATGAVAADVNSEIHNGRSATGQERLESALSFALINGAMSGGRALRTSFDFNGATASQAESPTQYIWNDGGVKRIAWGDYEPHFGPARSEGVPVLGMSNPYKLREVWGTNDGVDTIKSLYDKAQHSVVRIETVGDQVVSDGWHLYRLPGSKIGSGSGFFLNKHGDVVTNAHVVASGDKFNVQYDGSKPKIPYFVDRVFSDLDLAILKPHPDAPKYMDIQPLPRAKTAAGLQRLDRVLGFGYPRGTHDLVASPGTYEYQGIKDPYTGGPLRPGSLESRELVSEMQVHPGNSGGPLVNERGEVVGIVNIKTVSLRGEDQSAAIPVDYLNRLVKDEPQSDRSAPSDQAVPRQRTPWWRRLVA